MEELFRRLKASNTQESVDLGLAFVPEARDVFITTYPKCGTTWVSFIAHSLRTRGNIDFDEITAVVPWTIYAHFCGQDINAPQVALPRLFKSHENYDTMPKGGKCIYVCREPSKVCLSFYHFLLDFVQMDTSELSLQEFVEGMFAGAGSKSGRIWDHFLSFYRRKDDPQVLWVFYEDLLADPARHIEVIAEFIGVPLDDELRAIVLEQASFQFMKDHQELFDDHLIFDKCKVNMGLSPDTKVRASKVNKGEKGDRSGLTQEILETLNDRWNAVITAETGLASYQDLRNELSVLRR